MFTQKRIYFLVLAIILTMGSLIAQETVIDVTGNDFTHDEYVGTYGRQILVTDSGDVHVVYQKSWFTENDTGYNIIWKNLTTGAIDTLPFQKTQNRKLASPGVAYIGGGFGEAPVYFNYGLGGRVDKWGGEGLSKRGSMYLAAMAKISNDGDTVVGLGNIQGDKYYYPPMPYPYPISMEIDPVAGIVHCLITNQDGFAVGYWNFDGTNFGEVFRMYSMDANNDTPGKAVPEKYRRNGTKGADLAISSDGSEVCIAGLHPACNIWLHKGIFGGELWDKNFFEAMDNGTCINLFDTTGTATGDNFNNNDPKPYTDIQVVYDENDKLAVVYTATYIDQWMDTSKTAPWANWSNSFRVIDGDTIRADTTFNWSVNYTSMPGDTLGTFYDGTEHPKPQLRFWSEVTGTHNTIAESIYPLPGQTLKFWEDGIVDSGYAAWGNGINDGLISHFNLTVNKDTREYDPKLVLAYQQCNSEPEMVACGIDPDGSPAYNYYSYYSDIFVAVSIDGATWLPPINVTNTPDKDEVDLSINRDVIDNKIHMLYFRDSKAGRDDWLSRTDEISYYNYKPKGIFGIPIRKDPNDQVEIIYKLIDLTDLFLWSGVENKNEIPVNFELSQNYPNPFNPSTMIEYRIPKYVRSERQEVRLVVYDILGREVATLVNKEQQAGYYEVQFDASHLSSGIYYYRLTVGNSVNEAKQVFEKTMKMILLK